MYLKGLRYDHIVKDRFAIERADFSILRGEDVMGYSGYENEGDNVLTWRDSYCKFDGFDSIELNMRGSIFSKRDEQKRRVP